MIIDYKRFTKLNDPNRVGVGYRFFLYYKQKGFTPLSCLPFEEYNF